MPSNAARGGGGSVLGAAAWRHRDIFTLIIGLMLSTPAVAEPCAISYRWDPASRVNDWLVSPDHRAMRPAPAGGERVAQNPPVFRWPYREQAALYELEVTDPEGRTATRQGERNWTFWPNPLAVGEHAWRLRFKAVVGEWSPWSTSRKFIVPNDAHRFVVPDLRAAFERARAMARPRAMPKGEERAAIVAAIEGGDRHELFTELVGAVSHGAQRAVMAAPEMDDAEDDAAWRKKRDAGSRETIKRLRAETELAYRAATVWYYTGNDKFLDEARTRALHLASWDPAGPINAKSDDIATKVIVLRLSQVYDIIKDRLSEGEAAKILDHIAFRVEDLINKFVAGGRRSMVKRPYDSHGYEGLTSVVAASVLLAGDVPEAEKWFADAVPLYIAITLPWGDDGAGGNGTQYAISYLLSDMEAFDVLRRAAGIDLFQTAWGQESGRFFAYFVPPGSPAGVFGDGAEFASRPFWARIGALYAQRVPSPLAEWYAGAMDLSENVGPSHRLDNDLVLGPVTEPRGLALTAASGGFDPCDAIVYPSTGWAAMHSDLLDPDRLSIYFRSSPLGTDGHLHADQNGFVINAGGRRLAIDSGYKDRFRTPHRLEWTIQTRAHNAITFDGGQGQLARDMNARGAILAFAHGSGLDYVVGDATEAYGGQLTEAVRTLAYVRGDHVLVYDRLVSTLPRAWEWNIHALQEIDAASEDGIKIENGKASLCIRQLAGPPMSFNQRHGFPVKPVRQTAPEWPEQWHGRFTVARPSSETELLFLLSAGCSTSSDVSATPRPEGGFFVSIGGRRLAIDTAEAAFEE